MRRKSQSLLKNVGGRLRVSGVIWDIDGVLVDNRSMYHHSRKTALVLLGLTSNQVEPALAIWDRLLWFFDEDEIPGILRAIMSEMRLSSPEEDEVIRGAVEAYHSIWTNEITPVDGMVNLVHTLRRAEVRQAVVSNGDPDYQAFKLSSLGILDVFDDAVIVKRNDSEGGKPNPDGILIACSKLGVLPDAAVYIGDRPSDMIAANLAGVKSIKFNRTPLSPEVKLPSLESALRIEKAAFIVETADQLADLLGIRGQ